VRSAQRPRIVFITGTDTGVGKTVLTALLLSHLRQTGARGFAIKPFCSGGRGDARLLCSLQNEDLTLDQVNPFYFPEPLAPIVAARLHGRKITLPQTLRHIQQISHRLSNPSNHQSQNPEIRSTTPSLPHSTTPILLIEGAGGLLSPLGEKLDLLTLIQRQMNRSESKRQNVSVIVTAANRLGTINHTLLTVGRLQDAGVKRISVILSDAAPKERLTLDAKSNHELLAESLHPLPLFLLPYLGSDLADAGRLQAIANTRRVLLENIVSSLCR
jgi:dethiobiotin synthetase